MPVYRLSPIAGQRHRADWASTRIRCSVWLVAPDEFAARHAIARYSLILMRRRFDPKLLTSPWYQPVLTSCEIDAARPDIPADTITPEFGKSIHIEPIGD